MGSTTDDITGQAPAPSDIAAACREAGFARIVGVATGEALAGVGLLSRALRETGTPVQASLSADGSLGDTEADLTLTVGIGGADIVFEGPSAPLAAYEAATELVGEPVQPVLAVAGLLAAGAEPATDEGGPLEAAALERRPGVGVPIEDLVDGLAHTTLIHLPSSADVDATRTVVGLAELADSAEVADSQESVHREIASRTALHAIRDRPARAAAALERVLHPYVGGPFETVAGYADVLEALARERPGDGVALVSGHGSPEAALETWRSFGRIVHRALHDARVDAADDVGVLTVSFDDDPVVAVRAARLGMVARLAGAFLLESPVVLAVASGERDECEAAALVTEAGHTDRSAGGLLGTALETLDAAPASTGGRTQATATFDALSTASLGSAIRGEL